MTDEGQELSEVRQQEALDFGCVEDLEEGIESVRENDLLLGCGQTWKDLNSGPVSTARSCGSWPGPPTSKMAGTSSLNAVARSSVSRSATEALIACTTGAWLASDRLASPYRMLATTSKVSVSARSIGYSKTNL